MKRRIVQLRSGFTLIELLVVVGIIAVISAMLMVALHVGRESSDAAQCIQNLRTLAGANLRYLPDHEGHFCFAMQANNNVRWHGARTDDECQFDPTRGPLAPYLGREARIHACPAFVDKLKGDASFENGSGGYGYNEIYIGGTPANHWEGELFSNVPSPGRTVMFTDSALSRRDGIQEYPFAEPYQWVSPTGRLAGPLSPSVHFRHRGFAHVAWCDGHVTPERPAVFGDLNYYGGDDTKNRIGWFGPKDNNGYWNPRFEPPF